MFDDICICLDTVPQHDGQTDRRVDWSAVSMSYSRYWCTIKKTIEP